MDVVITISHLDTAIATWITQESQRTGLSIEVILRNLIYQGFAIERQTTAPARYHDLDALAGTWTSEESEEFRVATADLNKVDQELWP